MTNGTKAWCFCGIRRSNGLCRRFGDPHFRRGGSSYNDEIRLSGGDGLETSESDRAAQQASRQQAVNDYGYSFRAIEFTGTTKEYFGIWISNLVLTVVTLGIYSAWAKVRRIRFFRNHTIVADFALGYHATGMQLLIGRIIAVAIIVAYSIVSAVEPIAVIFITFAFLFLFSWLVNRSLRFNARMTSWRNIRFNWHGTYWKTFWFFGFLPVVVPLTAGILIPLAAKYYYKYYAKQHSFGTTRFDADPGIPSFYLAFLFAIISSALITVIVALVIGSAVFLIGQLLGIESQQYPGSGIDQPVAGAMNLWQLAAVTVVVFPIALFSMFRTMCRNILISSLILENAATFDSDLSPVRYLWIQATNFLAIVCSLGLLIPWASVREYRYLSQCTAYRFELSDAQFVDDEQARMSAFGEEFASFEGIEISI